MLREARRQILLGRSDHSRCRGEDSAISGSAVSPMPHCAAIALKCLRWISVDSTFAVTPKVTPASRSDGAAAKSLFLERVRLGEHAV